MHLPRTGLWASGFDMVDSPAATDLLAELEELGYGVLWIPETLGRDALVHSTLLLSRTERLIVATGIASIWSRDPMAMAAGQLTIAEAYPDRFLLGLGVSHQPMVDFIRGHQYDKPLTAMRGYLEKMDGAMYMAPRPATPPTRVLAALGPKMLALSAEQAGGAHTYNVTPDHTASAREILGPDPILAVEQMVVLATDPEVGRARGRETLALYMTLPNYTNNLRRFGFGDEDLEGGGSDRLVDALVAWGDVDAIVARVDEHLAAGASHVCVQVLGEAAYAPTPTEWRELAPALLSR